MPQTFAIDTKRIVELKKAHHEERFIDSIRYRNILEKNDFVLSMASDLSVKQVKLLYAFLSRIENYKEKKPIRMNLNIVLKILGLTNGGENRKRLKRDLLDLRRKSFWVNTLTDKGEIADSAVGFVDKVDVTSTDCIITFSDYMYEQLGAEGGNYCTPVLGTIIALKSKHMINLYRFLKAEAYKGQTDVSIDELRRITECTNKFLDHRELTRNVVKRGVDMINAFGDISVSYESYKLAGKTAGYYFFIRKKTSTEALTANLAAKAQIEGKLISPLDA